MEKVCLNSSLCVHVWLNGREGVRAGGRGGVVVEGTAVTESLHK